MSVTPITDVFVKPPLAIVTLATPMSTAGIIASRRWTEQAVTFDGDFDRVTRRRAGTAPGAAADPRVDRRAVAAGLPAHRPARRRLVPSGGTGADLTEAQALVAEDAPRRGRRTHDRQRHHAEVVPPAKSRALDKTGGRANLQRPRHRRPKECPIPRRPNPVHPVGMPRRQN
jgi:hypothetical protein